MKWPRFVKKFANPASIETARKQLEQSRSEAPAVAELAADLRREYGRNNFARRVDASLRGRP